MDTPHCHQIQMSKSGLTQTLEWFSLLLFLRVVRKHPIQTIICTNDSMRFWSNSNCFIQYFGWPLSIRYSLLGAELKLKKRLYPICTSALSANLIPSSLSKECLYMYTCVCVYLCVYVCMCLCIDIGISTGIGRERLKESIDYFVILNNSNSRE